jgi:hypothetical protein
LLDPHPVVTETLRDPPDPAKEWAAERAANSAAAKELDSILAIIRNPKTDRERRLLLADSYQRDTESLIPRFRIPWKKPRKRKLGEFLEAVERLEPEVTTYDLILALDVLSDFEEPCWPVALEENTWCQVMEAAASNAGMRLQRELRLLSWSHTSVLMAVRDLRAGLIDHYGKPLGKEPGQEPIAESIPPSSRKPAGFGSDREFQEFLAAIDSQGS